MATLSSGEVIPCIECGRRVVHERTCGIRLALMDDRYYDIDRYDYSQDDEDEGTDS